MSAASALPQTSFFGAGSETRAAWLICRGAWLEALRRKDAYVLLILMGLFALGAGISGLAGVENAATGNMLLNLGLTLAHGASLLLTALMASRQIPDELESRTIYPLLARPLSRASFIAGKFAASFSAGVMALVVFLTMTFLSTVFMPRSETPLSVWLFLQMAILFVISIAAGAGMSMLASLFLPKFVVAAAMAGWVFFGGWALAIVNNLMEGKRWSGLGRWTLGYAPDFSKLDLTSRFTDSAPALGMGEFLGVVAYGTLIAAASLLLAERLFRMRRL